MQLFHHSLRNFVKSFAQMKLEIVYLFFLHLSTADILLVCYVECHQKMSFQVSTYKWIFPRESVIQTCQIRINLRNSGTSILFTFLYISIQNSTQSNEL